MDTDYTEDTDKIQIYGKSKTIIEVGLVLNFGPTAEFRRKIFDNERKGSLSWINQPSFP